MKAEEVVAVVAVEVAAAAVGVVVVEVGVVAAGVVVLEEVVIGMAEVVGRGVAVAVPEVVVTETEEEAKAVDKELAQYGNLKPVGKAKLEQILGPAVVVERHLMAFRKFRSQNLTKTMLMNGGIHPF